MKYLLMFAFLGVVWWIWSKRNASGDVQSPARPDRPAEKMVTCAHCGVYLPESDGLLDGDRVYCCEAHRAAAQSVER
jgi:uncharacterized protein